MIQVINRALDIIEFIAREPEKPKSLSDIANTLELNAGTCANIIKTLVERNYIEKLEYKKRLSIRKEIWPVKQLQGIYKRFGGGSKAHHGTAN